MKKDRSSRRPKSKCLQPNKGFSKEYVDKLVEN